MRRRIALTILATVWAALLAAGAASYWATRSVLLADLDARLLARALAVPEVAAGPPDDERYVVRSEADGRTFRRRTNPPATGPTTMPAAGRPAPPPPPQVLAASFATLADGRRVRSLTVRVPVTGTAADDDDDDEDDDDDDRNGVAAGPVVVTYSGPAEPFHQALERLLWTLGVGGAAAGLATAAIAYVVSSTALRPLRDVARAVGSIDERHLDRRVAVADLPPELRPVGRRLNRMLGKLDQAFARRRQFLADAAHELRTPVAALVTGLEVALARPRSAEAYQAKLAEALADAGGLRALVERLMEQVRGEAFGPGEPEREVDVAALLAEAVRGVGPLARRQGVPVRSTCPPGLRARVRPAQLASVLGNLLSNAVDYNRPGGTVDVSARADGARKPGEAGGPDLRLTVVDTGVGIPPDRHAAVFEPFVRGDAARTGGDEHTGLGLFLVRTHLTAMGGRWAMRSRVGVGTEFDVTLPGAVAAVASSAAADSAATDSVTVADASGSGRPAVTANGPADAAGKFS